MRDCIKRIVEKTGVKKQIAKDITRDVEAVAKRRSREEVIEYEDAVEQVIKERIANVEANIKKQKADQARNFIVLQREVNATQGFVDAGLEVSESAIALIEGGLERPIPGVKNSLNAQKNAVKSIQLSEFIGKMTRENLMTIFADGKLSDEIGAALWDLSYDKKPTVKNKEALRIAEIIHEVRENQRLRMNKAGADVGKLSGYTMPQRHDIHAMIMAGKDKWIAFMSERLDRTRSFGGDYAELNTALSSAYDAMVSGVRLSDPAQQDAKLFQFTGPANLAKKLSRSRELHFKNHKAWNEWNNEFGMKSLHEGIIESIAKNAEDTALLERFGTNPEAMMKEIFRKIVEKNRNKMKAGNGEEKKIENIIIGAMEKQKIPASATLASIGSINRSFQQLTKLGGAGIAALISDPLFKSFEYQYQGRNFLSASAQAFKDVAYGFKNKSDRIEFSSLLGVYMESVVGGIGARFSSFDDTQGIMTKINRLFFRANALTWLTDNGKASFSRTMAHHLGLKAGKGFDELDADTKRLFGNYDINPADWDTMRAAVITYEGDGRAYVLAEKIPDKKVAQKLVTYILDREASGVISPGAREQRIATGGNTQRGTPVGELIRTVMQFKNFPLTISTKVIGRAAYGKGKPDVSALIQLALLTGVAGYLTGAAKDVIRNKTPKDPAKFATVMHAMATGGGYGFVGDLLFAEPGFGKNPLVNLMGPTVGTAGDAVDLAQSALWGTGSKRRAAMLAINSIPGNNLFYTRAALDQLILLQMQEELNPGYLRRTQRNAEKTYGQKPLFK